MLNMRFHINFHININKSLIFNTFSSKSGGGGGIFVQAIHPPSKVGDVYPPPPYHPPSPGLTSKFFRPVGK